MKIKELLSSPKKWARGSYAKDKYGCSISSRKRGAFSFCLIGAIRKCYPEGELQYEIQRKLTAACGRDRLEDFNDNPNTTFADIKKLVTELDI